MKQFLPSFTISLSFNRNKIASIKSFFEDNILFFTVCILSILSVAAFMYYYTNGLALAYNDARSHLNIGRRVVEGLKPGFAQLGSVWLPLPHLLMVPTIWNNFMWHSGLAGGIQSMISYILTGLVIFLFSRKIGIGMLGSLIGTFVFATNLNILYLQSTAMTELLLLFTMTMGVYDFMLWYKHEKIYYLVRAAFWMMLSTLIRYDGWFLLAASTALLAVSIWKKYGYKKTEGLVIFFCTLGGFGVFLWFLWNQLIFDDAFYFAFGPYSARAQQQQLEEAGVLATKGDLLYSLKIYFYAMAYNSGTFIMLLGILGGILFWFDKHISTNIKIACLALLSPFAFNILALFLGHSVLYVQGLSGNSWFNVRYGVMMVPSIAIFIGYLVHRMANVRYVVIGLLLFVTAIAFVNHDAVTIDDARFGSSGKNVTEVSGWLRNNTFDKEGFVLISAASHDAIIFSSGLPMERFIHEGTGLYWDKAVARPESWARWIIMRTNDTNDMTFKLVQKTGYLDKYTLVRSFPFADIYELKPQYVKDIITQPILGRQR